MISIINTSKAKITHGFSIVNKSVKLAYAEYVQIDDGALSVVDTRVLKLNEGELSLYTNNAANKNKYPNLSWIIVSDSELANIIKLAEKESEIIDIKINKITFEKESIEILVGETDQLILKIIPKDATNKEIIWKSNDESVVLVSTSGLISAVTPGTTKIIASDSNQLVSAECIITVIE